MTDNPIIDWYSKDQWLCDFLVSIDQKKLSDEDAAKEAFYTIAEHYKLPKFPEDVDDGNGGEGRSVFEEMAIIKYMFPEDELKGAVMLALYNVYNNDYIPIDEAATLYYGDHDKIPKDYMVYYFGKDVDASVKFDIGNLSWIEAGVMLMKKVINND